MVLLIALTSHHTSTSPVRDRKTLCLEGDLWGATKLCTEGSSPGLQNLSWGGSTVVDSRVAQDRLAKVLADSLGKVYVKGEGGPNGVFTEVSFQVRRVTQTMKVSLK